MLRFFLVAEVLTGLIYHHLAGENSSFSSIHCYEMCASSVEVRVFLPAHEQTGTSNLWWTSGLNEGSKMRLVTFILKLVVVTCTVLTESQDP